MKLILTKDVDILSQFDYINGNDIPFLERPADVPPQIRSTPHQKILIKNHTDANKGKIKGYLYLENIFGFCKCFKKITKSLGFHLFLKTADLQDITYTSLTDDKNVTNKNLYLILPMLLPSVETQFLFNEAAQNIYNKSYNEFFTVRRVISDFLVQQDRGSAQQLKSPNYLISAHQTKDRILTPKKAITEQFVII